MTEPNNLSVATLKWCWIVALVVGGVAFALALLWVNSDSGPGFDWIWLVAAFGLAAIIYNAMFFVLCSLYAPGLADLVIDETKVEGDNVAHVVNHATTGDDAVDGYVRAYATARGTTAVSIVMAVMGGLALAFF